MTDRTLTTVAALVILGLEAITCLAGLYTGDYTGLKIVSPVMLMLAAKVFGQDYFTKKARKEEQE